MVNKRLINTGEAAPAPFDPLQNFETVTYTGNGGTQKITGYIRKGAAFNGSSSYISGLPILTNVSDSFSVSMWVNFASAPSTTEYIFGGIKEQGTEDSLIGIFVNTSGYIGANARGSNNGTVYSATSTSSFADGNWHHVVYTLNSSILQLYIDNSQIGSDVSISSATVTVDNSVLGAINSRGTIENYFNGKLDQVRIFNRAITANEVETLYYEVQCIPTIVPSEHFNTVIWTGENSSVNRSITGVGFQPDFTWVKVRNYDQWNHQLYDSVRGAGSEKALHSNGTGAEGSGNEESFGYLSSFDIDGFTSSVGTSTNQYFNTPNYDMVAWNFKAGGPDVLNQDGTIDSQVSANTEAGFSIVSYTGNGQSNVSIGHGLNSTPSIVITKNRDLANDWHIFGTLLGQDNFLLFTTTSLITAATYFPLPNINTINYGTNSDSLNGNGSQYISYCFAEVDGFSKFGSYTGTGSSVTQSIVTGFEPAFVIIKDYSAGGSWWIEDNKRGAEKSLKANSSDAESTPNYVEFLENGFTVTNGLNDNSVGSKYIYMAFAEEVFVPDNFFNDDSTVATYKLDGNAGDDSGNGYNGITSNVTYAAGKFDEAAVFNGSSGGIDLPSNTPISNQINGTVSLWFNVLSNTKKETLIRFANNDEVLLRININGTLDLIGVRQSNNSYISYTTSGTYNDGTWHHLVMTRESGSIKFYIDDNLDNTLSWNNTFVTASNETAIGWDGYTSSTTLTGKIDQVRIFDRALDSGEVTQLYNE